MKSLSAIFIGFLLLSSCTSGEKIDNDLKKENLKGDVILVAYDDRITLYNEAGMEIRSLTGDDRIIMESIRNYQNGKLINQIRRKFISPRVASYDNLSESKLNYKYNSNGFLISTQDETYTSIYNYNQDQDITEIAGDEAKGLGGFKQIQKFFYTKHILDSIRSISDLGSVKYHTYSYYSKNGQMSSALNFVRESDNSITNKNITAFKYDENGNEKTRITTEYDVNNAVQKVTEEKFEYSYDPIGNWIEKKAIIGGQEDNLIKRTIVYKGEDGSSYISKYETLIIQISNSLKNINNSNLGNNNTANNQQNYSNQQNSQQSQRGCSYCNGTGRCKTCGRTFKVEFWDDTYHWTSRNESRPGLVMCSTCRGSGAIYGLKSVADKRPPSKSCNVCGGSGWKTCPDCNYSGNGKNVGQCSHCNGTGISR